MSLILNSEKDIEDIGLDIEDKLDDWNKRAKQVKFNVKR